MISCAHCSTTVEDYATVCPGCGAEKVRSYESFFSWSTMIWGGANFARFECHY